MLNDFDDDDDYDENEADGFFSPAWLLEGITGSRYGTLSLKNNRLAFVTAEQHIFDAPLSQVTDVVFPWYYFSGGVQFRIGVDRHHLSFVQPNSEPGYPDIGAGRRTGKMWKSLLT